MGNGMNKVLPGLFIGNFRDSKDQEQIAQNGITHILSIHDNARKLPCNSDKEYLCIIASDSPTQNLTQFFPICNDFIHNARVKGGSVLIHCLAGMSRSASVVVVYLMTVTTLSWRDALKAVQGARNVANPNVGFLKQIHEFEKEKLQEERRRIREKYSTWQFFEEDEQRALELVNVYQHSMNSGEMCDGNCPPLVTCPRGLCNQPRSSRAGMRISKNSSNARSKSLTRTTPMEDYQNRSSLSIPEDCSRTSLGNGSPAKTPSSSTMRSDEDSTKDYSALSNQILLHSVSNEKKAIFESPTPPSSPLRNYSYYTTPPSPINSSRQRYVDTEFNLTKTSKNGKVIHCLTSKSLLNETVNGKKFKQNSLTPPLSPRGMKKVLKPNDKNRSTLHVNLTESNKSSPVLEKSKLKEGSFLLKNKVEVNVKHNINDVSSDDQRYGTSENSENIPKGDNITQSPYSSKFYQIINYFVPKFNAKSQKLCNLFFRSDEMKSSDEILVCDTENTEKDSGLILDQENSNSSLTQVTNARVSSALPNTVVNFQDKRNEDINKREAMTIASKSCYDEKELKKLSLECKFGNSPQNSNINVYTNPIFKDIDDTFGNERNSSCKAYLKDDVIYVEAYLPEQKNEKAKQISSTVPATPLRNSLTYVEEKHFPTKSNIYQEQSTGGKILCLEDNTNNIINTDLSEYSEFSGNQVNKNYFLKKKTELSDQHSPQNTTLNDALCIQSTQSTPPPLPPRKVKATYGVLEHRIEQPIFQNTM